MAKAILLFSVLLLWPLQQIETAPLGTACSINIDCTFNTDSPDTIGLEYDLTSNTCVAICPDAETSYCLAFLESARASEECRCTLSLTELRGSKAWGIAKNDCISLGLTLPVIHSQERMDELKAHIGSGTSVWLGLTDSEIEGMYLWVDGTR